MSSFILALQFLTIIPVRVKDVDDRKLAWSLAFYPAVGAFLGIILVGICRLLWLVGIEPFSSAIILVVALIIITGGLHLDGLSDTMDAFLSRKDREEMLRIMRDSHIGAMGVLGALCIILLKIAFLISIGLPLIPISLILMCVLSRWALVFCMFLFPYAREEGKAKVFIQGINLKIFICATLTALAFILVGWQLRGLIIFMVIAVCAFMAGVITRRKIGGITGDTIGATNEVMEVVTLSCVCILEKTGAV